MKYVLHKFPFDIPVATEVWFSDQALDDFTKFLKKGDPDGAFLKKLEQVAKVGFELHIASGILEHRWGGVYRFGIKKSLFRLVGFFEPGSDGCSFLVIRTHMKSGQKLSRAEREDTDETVRVRNEADWRKARN